MVVLCMTLSGQLREMLLKSQLPLTTMHNREMINNQDETVT